LNKRLSHKALIKGLLFDMEIDNGKLLSTGIMMQAMSRYIPEAIK